MSELETLLDVLADRIAARVVTRLRASETGMVDQAASPLGRRRHCARVKARVAQGQPGAAVVGRRHLLSPEALAEELGRVSAPKVANDSKSRESSVREELERELSLLRRVGR